MQYPGQQDNYNVEVFNQNFREIENRIQSIEEGGGSSGGIAYIPDKYVFTSDGEGEQEPEAEPPVLNADLLQGYKANDFLPKSKEELIDSLLLRINELEQSVKELNGNLSNKEMVFDLDDMYGKVAGRPYVQLFDNTAKGAPSGNYGIVIGSYFFTKENALQIAMDLSSNDLYTRKLSANTWSGWKRYGTQIKSIRSKLFSCDETVEPYETKRQTYSISDLGFSATPNYAVQMSNWLNTTIAYLTKDSIEIVFFNPSPRGIAGTAGHVQLVFWEIE